MLYMAFDLVTVIQLINMLSHMLILQFSRQFSFPT